MHQEENKLNLSGLAWLAAMAFLLASGCAVDQAREVQTYREVLDAGQTQPPAPFSPNESAEIWAVVMNCFGNKFFAGSGFTQN